MPTLSDAKPIARIVPDLPELERSARKKQAFTRLAASRVRKVLHATKILGHCGNRNSYTYTPEQVAEVFAAIDAGVVKMKAQFEPKQKKETETFEFKQGE